MTDLTRKEQLIFANNSTTNQVAVFGSKAQTGTMAFSSDPDVIQDVENNGQNWRAGWNNAIINGNSPLMEDFNAISYVNSYNIAYLLQKGIAEWSANTTYYIGDVVKIINDNKPILYFCKVAETTGTNHNPITDNTNWELFFDKNEFLNIDLTNISETGQTYIKSLVDENTLNINVSNITQTGIDTIMTYNIPDYSAGVSVTEQQLINGYTSQSKGILYITAQSSTGVQVYVNNVYITDIGTGLRATTIILDINDIVKVSIASDLFKNSIFFPFKGVNND